MNKNLLLVCVAVICSLFAAAQTPQQIINSCGTGIPPKEWDEWLNSKVEAYKQSKENGKSTSAAVHEIPVIVHVLYFNEALNTYPNIDSNQVKSQIAALNADFAGTGYNV